MIVCKAGWPPARRAAASLFLIVPLLAPVSARPQDAPAAAPGGAARPRSEALNYAHSLLRDRRYDLAAEEYEEIIKGLAGTPQDEATRTIEAEARYGLASARLFLGQYREARKHFEQFVQDNPSHPNAATAWFRVGETAYMLGDLQAARAALDRYTRDHPDHRHGETAWPYLGDVSFRLGDLPASKQAYEQALARFPKGRQADRARYGLGRTLARLDQTEAASKLFEEIVQGGNRDWSDRARFQLGLVQLQAGRPAEAIAELERLEQEAPRSPLLPEARLRRAEALGQLRRFDEAMMVLRPLANAEGGLAPQAAYTLASLQLNQGRPAEALATCDEALGRHAGSPMGPLLLFRSAEAAEALDRPDEARARFLKVLETAPQDDWADDALLRAAELALKRGDAAGAAELAAQFPRRFPGNAHRANARLIEAQAALARKDAPEAIALLEALLAEDHPSEEVARSARLALGVAYRAAGQAEKAAEALRGVAGAPDAAGSAEAQYVLAAGHFDAGRFDQAIPLLEAYLAGKPMGDVVADALAMLAVAQQEQGRTEEARAALTRLEAEYPQSKALAPTRLRLGEAALDDQEYERAEALLEQAAEGASDPAMRARALSGLGWARLEGKRPEAAAEAFAKLLELAPQHELAAEAALALGRAWQEAGKLDRALAAFAAVSEKYPGTRQALSARLGEARLLVRQEQFDAAAKAYERLLAENPAMPEGWLGRDELTAEYGWALLDAGKRAEADAVFRRLLEERPDSPRAADARVVLAESAHLVRDHAKVDELLAPLLAEDGTADPTSRQSALFRAGLSKFDRQDWSAAAQYFGRLVEQFPDSPLAAKARFWKAETAFQSGDAKGAEAAFAELLAAPGSPDAADWIGTARLRRAECLVALELWKDALEVADALKADMPMFPAMHELEYARGRALQGMAQFEEARAAYQAVIDAGRADDYAARAQLMRGETYFHQQKYREALREFLKVQYNHDAPAWQAAALLEAGKVAERLERWKDAADFYQKLQKQYPDDPHAAQAAERLRAVQARLGEATTGKP